MRSHPSHADSTGKLLNRLALLTGEEVYQGGKLVLSPREVLLVQPSLARSFSCVSGCTACCLPFTLDFIPKEMEKMEDSKIKRRTGRTVGVDFQKRKVEVNGSQRSVYTYPQYKDDRCPYLGTRPDGNPGCSFWDTGSGQPLECAAAPQLLMSTRGDKYATLSKRPFGRAWAWQETPQCEFTDLVMKPEDIPDDLNLSNEIELLERYKAWANLFQIKTVISPVIKILRNFKAELEANNMQSISVPLQ